MKGLIVRLPWIDYILDGFKTWEIRGSSTKNRGKIALIQSQSGLIVGTANLIDCKPLSLSEYQRSTSLHCIENCLEAPYKNMHAWILTDAVRLQTPIPYIHPQGAVIWVNLDKHEGLSLLNAS
ncbi:ASCH domain-containing protein [Paenibacillus polymyxa]|uniref:ASCH domain-containing protein n=1 Tax=Paenibacillus polymyxa (strain SC2) TaxID=886882 RepID=A0A0D5ZCP7_PAEPS|nr:ASCH domain-containing protein [Paenibacillus polymyxa]AKA44393.1 hypothetical protein PPSC2_28210 [Paenibacillus polymyxa SC2]WPQ59788.1 ASCH domain-containing protein [Paenibacillus polymyxa]